MSDFNPFRTCRVCGSCFHLTSAGRYTVTDNESTGLAKAIGSIKSKCFDAFDCPYCGCQNLIQIRLKKCPCEYGICDECNEEKEEESDE